MKYLILLAVIMAGLIGCEKNESAGQKKDNRKIIKVEKIKAELLGLGGQTNWQEIAFVLQRSANANSAQGLTDLANELDKQVSLKCDVKCHIKNRGE